MTDELVPVGLSFQEDRFWRLSDKGLKRRPKPTLVGLREAPKSCLFTCLRRLRKKPNSETLRGRFAQLSPEIQFPKDPVPEACCREDRSSRQLVTKI